MNFFEQQEKALKRSRLLILSYLLCICLIISVIYFTVFFLFSVGSYQDLLHQEHFGGAQFGGAEFAGFNLWNTKLFFTVCVLTLGVIALGTVTKVYALSGGGSAVAESLGGVFILPNTTDAYERRLLNIVEEMAIASGLPVPKVYLLPEDSINAFAAGSSINNAVIGVTRGCMKLLSRDELQGVIAHEFSHILNGDMRLNLRLIGILSGLLILSQIGYWAFRLSSSSKRGYRKNKEGSQVEFALLVLGFVVMLMGYIGVFFSRIIKSAVSRQREFLADASAVQFTRNPLGISGALKKIGNYQYGSNILSENAEEASHLFFSSGFLFSSLFATHPPLALRIKKIDPSFDGKFKRLQDNEIQKIMSDNLSESKTNKSNPAINIPGVFIPGMEGLGDVIGDSLGAIKPETLILGEENSPQSIIQSIGKTDSEHLEYARLLRDSIPELLINASHEPRDAISLIYSLLLVSSDGDNVLVWEESLKNLFSDETIFDINKFLPQLASIPLSYRLPLIELCIPTLSSLSSSQVEHFVANIYKIITLDDKVSLFEYVISKIITNRLQNVLRKSASTTFRNLKLEDCQDSCVKLFSLIARRGISDDMLQEKAFFRGIELLFPAHFSSLSYYPDLSLKELDEVLETLRCTDFEVRRKILASILEIIYSDNVVTIEQSEIFRAVADTLDIPSPPIMPSTFNSSKIKG